MNDESRHDGLADVINLIAAPIAGGIRTVEQVRRGVDEMFRTVENLNRTIENLNEAAVRINRFMAEVEPAVQALLPQIRRTVEAADEMTSLLQGPVRAAAPNVERVVTALGSPGFLALPAQLGELMQRLGPLTQLAENAGGLLGGLRLSGIGRAGITPPPAATPTAPTATHTTPAATTKPSAKKRASGKRGATPGGEPRASG